MAGSAVAVVAADLAALVVDSAAVDVAAEDSTADDALHATATAVEGEEIFVPKDEEVTDRYHHHHSSFN